MKSRALIYIVSGKGGLVFDSQVEGLLKLVKEQQFFDKIILLAGVRSEENWYEDKKRLAKSDIELHLMKRFPNYRIFSRKQSNELTTVLKEIATDNTIIHIRGESLARSVYKATKRIIQKNIKIISDIRGAAYEERFIYNKKLVISNLLKSGHYKRNIAQAGLYNHAISCVSERLKQYVLERSKAKESDIYVNHCIAGEDFRYSATKRQIYRQKLGVAENEVLFVFLGQAGSGWQNAEIIGKGIANKGYKLLHLSDEKIDHNNIINLFVPYNEVANYLCAADIGVIWRNDDIVNNVASPTKFSEYVCCGLPVIANNGVHLINDYITKTKYGKTINDFSEIDTKAIHDLCSLSRNIISENAMNKFSSKIIVSNYISIYKNLLEY